MLLTLIFLAVISCGASVSADAQLPYLTEEDFMRAARLEPETTAFNFSRASFVDDIAVQETKLAWRYTKWDNARVPYVLDPKFTPDERANVAKAIGNYHSKTCVRFVPANLQSAADKDYVHISRDDSTCGLAELCRRGGKQFAKFGGGCVSSGVMTHELGHTLCFMHEQTRPDRDEYISWDTAKCTPHGKESANDWTTLDLLYDYVSIQHYEGECYNGCIKPRIGGVTKCGSGGTLSVLDVEKINAYYNCPGCNSYRFRPKRLISSNDRLVEAGRGKRGETLYPCRAYHNGDIVPGRADGSSCYVSYNSKEYKKDSNFEVLTNPKEAKLVWRRQSGNQVPANAIAGGRTAERETLYIGRCSFSDQGTVVTIPGKFHPSASSSLYIPYGGSELLCGPFEILVCEN